jgi:hypothetical protein
MHPGPSAQFPATLNDSLLQDGIKRSLLKVPLETADSARPSRPRHPLFDSILSVLSLSSAIIGAICVHSSTRSRISSRTLDFTYFPRSCRRAVMARYDLTDRLFNWRIHVTRSGRFGNNVHSTINALQVCEICGIFALQLPNDYLWVSSPFNTTLGVRVYLYNEPDFTSSWRNFFWRPPFLHPCSRQTVPGIANSFRLPWMKAARFDVTGNSSVLHLHLRSGDIFRPRPNPDYGQPPCSYYRGAIRRDFAHESVAILTEDAANPCVAILQAEGAVWAARGAFVDLREMIAARRLAMSLTTLGPAAVYLALEKTMVYGFRKANVGFHFAASTGKDFDRLIWNWSASMQQSKGIVETKVRRWDWVDPRRKNVYFDTAEWRHEYPKL